MKKTEKTMAKIMKEIEKYDVKDEEELNNLLQDTIKKYNAGDLEETEEEKSARKSDEILEEAYEAEDEKKAIRLAKKALEINPKNLDAETFLITFEEDIQVRLRKYDELIVRTEKELKEEGIVDDESIGHYYGILETRPYMRLRYDKLNFLKDLGSQKQAIREGEELLKLNENDNLGVRYTLMSSYAILEDLEKCEALYQKYHENSAFMLLPLLCCYLKNGKYKEARKCVKDLKKANPYLVDALLGQGEGPEDMNPEFYRPGSREEATIILRDSLVLLVGTPSIVLFLLNNTK